MWRLFPRSWFSKKDSLSRAQAQASDWLHEHWRDLLACSLSRVLKRSVTPAEAVVALQALQTSDLLALDQAARYGTWDANLGRPARGLVHLRPAEVQNATSEAFLFMAACHTNGFIREQAIVAFANCRGRLAMVIALIRSDDWVPQVREAGKNLLEYLTRPTSGAELFEHLELALAMRARKRFAQEIWLVQIEPALLLPENANHRWEATQHGSASVRRFAYSLVARADPERLGEVCRVAAIDSDPGLARWALETSSRSLPSNQARELVIDMLRHPHGSVRAAALNLLASADSQGSKGELESALFDRSRSARNVAAYLVRNLFQIDPADRWRDALSHDDARRSGIAMEALAEVAQPQDRERLLPWLSHRKGKMRAAALRGLDRAKHPQVIELSTAALGDTTTTVVREAIAILHRQPGALNQDLLLTARAATPNTRIEQLLIRSAQLLDKWDGLETYLTWYFESDPNWKQTLDGELENWRRSTTRRFTPLRDASRARIEEKLMVLSVKRPTEMWDDLKHAVAPA